MIPGNPSVGALANFGLVTENQSVPGFVVLPLIVPIAAAYEVNLVHLGIIFLTNLEIGYSMPPLGLNLFIASLRFRRSIVELTRVSLPFVGILAFALALITYVPSLSLFLVRAFGKGATP